jgi:hypothetical protein
MTREGTQKQEEWAREAVVALGGRSGEAGAVRDESGTDYCLPGREAVSWPKYRKVATSP